MLYSSKHSRGAAHLQGSPTAAPRCSRNSGLVETHRRTRMLQRPDNLAHEQDLESHPARRYGTLRCVTVRHVTAWCVTLGCVALGCVSLRYGMEWYGTRGSNATDIIPSSFNSQQNEHLIHLPESNETPSGRIPRLVTI